MDNPIHSAPAPRLEAAWPGAGFDWMECTGELPVRWIVRARSAEKPPVWLEMDAGTEAGGIRVLAECPVAVSPTVRKVVRWKASDGVELEGIFTRPAEKGKCPLVVFPHGGPGALSTVDFDERAWAGGCGVRGVPAELQGFGGIRESVPFRGMAGGGHPAGDAGHPRRRGGGGGRPGAGRGGEEWRWNSGREKGSTGSGRRKRRGCTGSWGSGFGGRWGAEALRGREGGWGARGRPAKQGQGGGARG